MFKRAHGGDVKLQKILERYGSMIATKRETGKWGQLVRNQLVSTRLYSNLRLSSHFPTHIWYSAILLSDFTLQVEENMMRHRAILTGTFQKATYYNKPFPKMKLQPLHVGVMIHKRIRARQRRRECHLTLRSWMKDVEEEAIFESALQRNATRYGQGFKGVFHHTDWCEFIFTLPLPQGHVWCQRC